MCPFGPRRADVDRIGSVVQDGQGAVGSQTVLCHDVCIWLWFDFPELVGRGVPRDTGELTKPLWVVAEAIG